MNLTITGRRFVVSESLKARIEKHVDKLEQFFDEIIDCDVKMSIEKHRKRTELTVAVHGRTLRASHESEDMGRSLDEAMKKMERQLKKIGSRSKDYKHIDKEALGSATSEAQ